MVFIHDLGLKCAQANLYTFINSHRSLMVYRFACAHFIFFIFFRIGLVFTDDELSEMVQVKNTGWPKIIFRILAAFTLPTSLQVIHTTLTIVLTLMTNHFCLGGRH